MNQVDYLCFKDDFSRKVFFRINQTKTFPIHTFWCVFRKPEECLEIYNNNMILYPGFKAIFDQLYQSLSTLGIDTVINRNMGYNDPTTVCLYSYSSFNPTCEFLMSFLRLGLTFGEVFNLISFNTLKIAKINFKEHHLLSQYLPFIFYHLNWFTWLHFISESISILTSQSQGHHSKS